MLSTVMVYIFKLVPVLCIYVALVSDGFTISCVYMCESVHLGTGVYTDMKARGQHQMSFLNCFSSLYF